MCPECERKNEQILSLRAQLIEAKRGREFHKSYIEVLVDELGRYKTTAPEEIAA